MTPPIGVHRLQEVSYWSAAIRNGQELRMKIVIGVAMIVAVLVIGCCLAMQFAYMREVR
jgi:hypothetical protein